MNRRLEIGDLREGWTKEDKGLGHEQGLFGIMFLALSRRHSLLRALSQWSQR